MPTLTTRYEMILELAAWYGNEPKRWRDFTQEALDEAYIIAAELWG